MAIKGEFEEVETFEDWYSNYSIDPRTGTLYYNGFTDCAMSKFQVHQYYKSEMDARVANYWKYEKLADAAVTTERPDLPNVSSGEAAGFIRKIARGVIQHTPNITITSKFDDDKQQGVIANYIAKSKIIGDDEYSNSMQQNLYATMIRASALGFDVVIPALLQNSRGSWYVQYDNINYRDVYPEPGAKDVRRATRVFVRRYLTRGEVHKLIQTQAVGWDVAALKSLIQTAPQSREYTDHQTKKHHSNPIGYEIITEYKDDGSPFLTWAGSMRMLLRIEKNKHPLKEHPVFFFVPDYDGQQPFGRSILSLIYGRQEFQDWFLNGAMKLWRLNIEPPIIGYGVVNTIPNIGPGKYTSIPNPNAKVEAFSVDTQSLLMFDRIAAANAMNMSQMIGAADQQMAAAGGPGQPMSNTPQGVQQQQQMVDITTNNYQKALESFFSRYCSYALTVYFQELKSLKKLIPSSDARNQLLNAGLAPEAFIHKAHTITVKTVDPVTGETTEKLKTVPDDGSGLEDGEIKADFSEMATLYYVKTVPGSLTELEDEKQIRLLNQMFIPLSQAMPAVAQSGDPEAMKDFSAAMRFIVKKQIELSGSSYSSELKDFLTGHTSSAKDAEDRNDALEKSLSGENSDTAQTLSMIAKALVQMQEQNTMLRQGQEVLFRQAGVQMPSSTPPEQDPVAEAPAPAVAPV